MQDDLAARAQRLLDGISPGVPVDFLVANKRIEPADDMFSIVANATVDDPDAPSLSDAELYLFFNLLFSAGAETTRNAVAGGLLALAEHPEQWAALRSDLTLLPSAVEEMVRWTSPSPSKRRTATCVATLGGQSIEPGQKVLGVGRLSQS